MKKKKKTKEKKHSLEKLSDSIYHTIHRHHRNSGEREDSRKKHLKKRMSPNFVHLIKYERL